MRSASHPRARALLKLRTSSLPLPDRVRERRRTRPGPRRSRPSRPRPAPIGRRRAAPETSRNLHRALRERVGRGHGFAERRERRVTSRSCRVMSGSIASGSLPLRCGTLVPRTGRCQRPEVGVIRRRGSSESVVLRLLAGGVASAGSVGERSPTVRDRASSPDHRYRGEKPSRRNPAPRTSAIEAVILGLDVRLHAMQTELARTRSRSSSGIARAHVSLPGERLERVVAEVRIAERPVEDLRQVVHPGDRTVLGIADQERAVGLGTVACQQAVEPGRRGRPAPARGRAARPTPGARSMNSVSVALDRWRGARPRGGLLRHCARGLAPRRSRARPMRDPRTPRWRPCALRGPCRPGRSARSRSAASSAGRRGRRRATRAGRAAGRTGSSRPRPSRRSCGTARSAAR